MTIWDGNEIIFGLYYSEIDHFEMVMKLPFRIYYSEEKLF